MRVVVAIGALALLAAPACAQEPTADWVFGAGGEDLVLELGLGGKVRPEYEGSDDYTLRPSPVIDLHYLRLPVLGTFGGGPETGISVGPSFRIIGRRDDEDNSEIAGLGDVPLAFELGGKVGYRYDMLRAFLAVRHGIGGHEGIVGEAGVDWIADPMPRLELSVGPRVSFADSEYLETYLGVTPSQSADSGLAVFEPDGGVKGAGVGAQARYALTSRWAVVGEAGYERLVGDAADSPVTELGSENQFTGALGLTYRFGLDLFD